MDVPSKPVGYEYVFVDKVPEDYFCNQCKHVAREPNITSCCGETFCRACVEATIEDKEPCPNCESNDVKALGLQVKYSRSIQSLRVHCSLKDCGCEWTGQLQHLDAHLDLTTGDCVYVDVDCPRQCNQKVQKCNVDTHLANHCPNRDYTCPHCSFKATFCEVTEHFEVCRYHPLMCPNRCGASFERDVLEEHLKMCGLQTLQCEFSYAGCTVEFIRDHQKDHMEQSTQKHLFLVAAASKKMYEMFSQKLEEMQKEFEKALEVKEERTKKALQKVFEKKLGEQREEFQKQKVLEEQLAEKDRQIKSLNEKHESDINSLRMEVGVPPFKFVVTNFKDKFTPHQPQKRGSTYIDSPNMFTSVGGYKFKLRLFPEGMWDGERTHLSVLVFSRTSNHDNTLKFPARFVITLELLNQQRDQDHYKREIECEVTRESVGTGMGIGSDWKFIPHSTLEWNEPSTVRYLLNDCLKFRVAVKI